MIQQTQPAGLLGIRTKTRTTVVKPLNPIVIQPVPQPPPDNGDDEEHQLQVELLRQIVAQLREKQNEEAIEAAARQNRDLLILLLQTIREQQLQPVPLPNTSRTTSQWRSVNEPRR